MIDNGLAPSANFRFLASIIPTRKELARVAVLPCPGGFLYPPGDSVEPYVTTSLYILADASVQVITIDY